MRGGRILRTSLVLQGLRPGRRWWRLCLLGGRCFDCLHPLRGRRVLSIIVFDRLHQVRRRIIRIQSGPGAPPSFVPTQSKTICSRVTPVTQWRASCHTSAHVQCYFRLKSKDEEDHNRCMFRRGILLAAICWAASAQRRCYATGRCIYRPSVIC